MNIIYIIINKTYLYKPKHYEPNPKLREFIISDNFLLAHPNSLVVQLIKPSFLRQNSS